jgi:Uma2 family endonuclease
MKIAGSHRTPLEEVMATDAEEEMRSGLLPPELHPNIEDLVTEDDTPVDSVYCEKQHRLLTESLHNSWDGGGRKFVAFTNVGLFYAIKEPPIVPDVMLSLDVEVRQDIANKSARSYFMWEYGKPPDVVIEVVSNKEGAEDTKKLEVYNRLRIGYYAIFDPLGQLSQRPLRVFQMNTYRYVEMTEPIWLPNVELGLRIWEGQYEDFHASWLRWFGTDGKLLKSGYELARAQQARADEEKARADEQKARADQQEARADEEKARADGETARADRLAQKLRELGVDPDA